MGVSRAYVVGSPYNGVELAEIDFEQTADTMFLAHIDHPPQELLRAGHTEWLFNAISFGPALDAPAGVAAVATTPNVDADNAGAAYFPQPDSLCRHRRSTMTRGRKAAPVRRILQRTIWG